MKDLLAHSLPSVSSTDKVLIILIRVFLFHVFKRFSFCSAIPGIEPSPSGLRSQRALHYTNHLISAFPDSELYRLIRIRSVQWRHNLQGSLLTIQLLYYIIRHRLYSFFNHLITTFDMPDNILFGIRLSETSNVFPLCLAELLVRVTGFEPVRSNEQQILSLWRLPVTPYPHI